MSLFSGLQQDAAACLAADNYFSDAGASSPRPITVLYEQLKDIQNQIALKVGQIGIVTLLLTVSGKSSNQNRQRPYFEDIRIVARTYENLVVNRGANGTQQSASDVALASGWILHGWRPEELSASLFCTDVLLVDHPKLFVWDAVFKIQAGMTNAAPVRVPLNS